MGFSEYVKRKTINLSRNEGHPAKERLKAEVANAAPAVTGAKARIAVRAVSLQQYVLVRVSVKHILQ